MEKIALYISLCALLMVLFKVLVGKRDTGISIGAAFAAAVEKYGLTGRADLKESGQGYTREWLLVRILKPREKPSPLPPGFVAEVQELASRCERMLRRIEPEAIVTLAIHPTGMTLKEILADQRTWAAHCAEYNRD